MLPVLPLLRLHDIGFSLIYVSEEKVGRRVGCQDGGCSTGWLLVEFFVKVVGLVEGPSTLSCTK